MAVGDSMPGPKRYGTGNALVKTMSAVELEEAEKLTADEISEVCVCVRAFCVSVAAGNPVSDPFMGSVVCEARARAAIHRN